MQTGQWWKDVVASHTDQMHKRRLKRGQATETCTAQIQRECNGWIYHELFNIYVCSKHKRQSCKALKSRLKCMDVEWRHTHIPTHMGIAFSMIITFKSYVFFHSVIPTPFRYHTLQNIMIVFSFKCDLHHHNENASRFNNYCGFFVLVCSWLVHTHNFASVRCSAIASTHLISIWYISNIFQLCALVIEMNAGHWTIW